MNEDEEEPVDYECHKKRIENEAAKKSFNAGSVAISRGSGRKERSRKRKFNTGLEKSGRVEIKGKGVEEGEG